MDNWTEQAACRGLPADVADSTFFPHRMEREEIEKALAICQDCRVITTCQSEAIKNERGKGVTYRFGIFGGLTPADRIRLSKARRPESEEAA